MADFLAGPERLIPPKAPEDFPMETADDVRRALRDHAKARDQRLIFDGGMLGLSEEGRQEAQANWLKGAPDLPNNNDEWFPSEMTAQEYLDACLRDDQHWDIVQARVDDFLKTPKGKEITRQLNNELELYLLGTFYYVGPMPQGLYDKIVETELCWRMETRNRHRIEHPEFYENKFNVDVVISFDSNANLGYKRTIQVPRKSTFQEFAKLLHHQTRYHAEQNRYPEGFILENGAWFYGWQLKEEESKSGPSNSDGDSLGTLVGIRELVGYGEGEECCFKIEQEDDESFRARFRPITEANFANFKEVLSGPPNQQMKMQIELTVWHELQMKLVQELPKPKPKLEDWYEAYKEWGGERRPGYTVEMQTANWLRRRDEALKAASAAELQVQVGHAVDATKVQEAASANDSGDSRLLPLRTSPVESRRA